MCIEGISGEVDLATREICEIATCTNYETNNCYCGQECRFLYYQPSIKRVENNHVQKIDLLQSQPCKAYTSHQEVSVKQHRTNKHQMNYQKS